MTAPLFECEDAGPWPCIEDGCPKLELSCSDLEQLGACAAGFLDMWGVAPNGTAAAVIHERCPRACGRCGLQAPNLCNMRRVDASTLSAEALADMLMQSESPLLIVGAMESWSEAGCWSFPEVLRAHAAVDVKVIEEGGRYRGEATKERTMPLAEYPRALSNQSLPDSAYVFDDVQGDVNALKMAREQPAPNTNTPLGRKAQRPSSS